MPVSIIYVSSKIALLRLAGVNDSITSIATIAAKLAASGMEPGAVQDMVGFLKSSLLDYIKTQIKLAADEAVISTLSGATESDDKNSLLTPIIAGLVVNPAAATNLVEQTTMLADGVLADSQLADLLNNAINSLQ